VRVRARACVRARGCYLGLPQLRRGLLTLQLLGLGLGLGPSLRARKHVSLRVSVRLRAIACVCVCGWVGGWVRARGCARVGARAWVRECGFAWLRA
jgi:hypothetical protein